eukprot:COSAG04_NODE_9725_length_836_cov_2.635007_1_plen_67_part_10
MEGGYHRTNVELKACIRSAVEGDIQWAQRRRFEAAEATLGAPILGVSKAALIDIQRQWRSEPCEIVT